MNINEEFISLCKENEIPLSEGFLFGIILEFQDQIPELKQFILNEGFFDYERYQPLQINLCTTNPETLKPELKVSLFGGMIDGEYEEFLDLLSQRGLTGKGFANNELEYSIFNTNSKIDRVAFSLAKSKIKNFSVEKCATVIINYYRSTQYAQKFANYVGSDAFIMDYKQTL